ncbi:MAG: alpha/beta fold hydrolase [Pseudomonadota bacterium]
MTPLVFLPGMMCDDRLFRPQLDVFTDRPCQVMLPIGSNRMADLASQVLADASDIFDLVGLSMGGILAMEVMAQAAHRVRKLVLFSTNARAETAKVAAARKPQMAAVNAGELARIMENDVISNFWPEGQDHPRLEALMLAQALELGPGAFLSQSKALMTRADQRKTLESLSTRTLVICGDGDRLCPPFRHEEIAGLLTNADLHILPGVGHLPVLEVPEKINPLLQHFLA